MPWSAEEQEVLDVMHSEWRAFYMGDLDEVARRWVHSDDVRRMTAGPRNATSVISGWKAMSTAFDAAIDRFPQKFVADDWLRWDNLKIHIGGDVAWASYDQVVIKFDERLLAPALSHEIKVLHRTEDGWKLISCVAVHPALSGDDVPQIEIGPDGKVSRINQLARERLADHPGLIVSGDRLRARHRAFEPGLQAGIARCHARIIWPPERKKAGLGATPLGEDDNGRPLYCWITAEQEKVLVTFDDAARMKTRLEVAADIFALSPAQLALCELLAEGADLNDAADALGVSVNTLRTQLRRMFDKTGTRGQTALISALLTVRQPR